MLALVDAGHGACSNSIFLDLTPLLSKEAPTETREAKFTSLRAQYGLKGIRSKETSMIGADELDAIRWYAIHTKAKQELRASCNLEAWGVETFAPCIEQRRYNHYSGKIEHVVEPLFTNYIFARFKSAMVSKIRFTRGVRNVVSFGGVATPIDDEIIDLIQSRMEHGFVKLDADLKRGDELRVQCGALEGLRGIFDRRTRSSTRVMMLLKTVSYQACAEVEELQVRKVG